MKKEASAALVERYNVPVPRYTSYPTVPFWPQTIDSDAWQLRVKSRFADCNEQEGINLYIHLPFCESLCTYCGCNKKITTNHNVELPYLKALAKEWKMVLDLWEEPPLIREIHLGGGTPTFFTPENLDLLLTTIKAGGSLHPKLEGSIEGHPNNTSRKHLEVLFGHGFHRISYGVQDNDKEVQRLINRIQPWENVVGATELARQTGFQSVNYDLIYGLPGQSLASMEKTIRQVLVQRPDRIAFYSYAHVPWTSRGQRLFDEKDLPAPDLKMQLYLLGKKMFTAAGYADIGMDHFALPGEALFEAKAEGKLHRNFMGYTTQATGMLIGLGVSSISDAGNAYAQNHKTLSEYYQAIEKGVLPVFRGVLLTKEDVRFKAYLLDITCKGFVKPRNDDWALVQSLQAEKLRQLEADGLIVLKNDGLEVTRTGNHFLRNIASIFDLYLLRKHNTRIAQKTFSQAV